MKNNKGLSPLDVLVMVFMFALALIVIVLIEEKSTQSSGAITNQPPGEYQCVNGLLLQQNKAMMANDQPIRC